MQPPASRPGPCPLPPPLPCPALPHPRRPPLQPWPRLPPRCRSSWRRCWGRRRRRRCSPSYRVGGRWGLRRGSVSKCLVASGLGGGRPWWCLRWPRKGRGLDVARVPSATRHAVPATRPAATAPAGRAGRGRVQPRPGSSLSTRPVTAAPGPWSGGDAAGRWGGPCMKLQCQVPSLTRCSSTPSPGPQAARTAAPRPPPQWSCRGARRWARSSSSSSTPSGAHALMDACSLCGPCTLSPCGECACSYIPPKFAVTTRTLRGRLPLPARPALNPAPHIHNIQSCPTRCLPAAYPPISTAHLLDCSTEVPCTTFEALCFCPQVANPWRVLAAMAGRAAGGEGAEGLTPVAFVESEETDTQVCVDVWWWGVTAERQRDERKHWGCGERGCGGGCVCGGGGRSRVWAGGRVLARTVIEGHYVGAACPAAGWTTTSRPKAAPAKHGLRPAPPAAPCGQRDALGGCWRLAGTASRRLVPGIGLQTPI